MVHLQSNVLANYVKASQTRNELLSQAPKPGVPACINLHAANPLPLQVSCACSFCSLLQPPAAAPAAASYKPCPALSGQRAQPITPHGRRCSDGSGPPQHPSLPASFAWAQRAPPGRPEGCPSSPCPRARPRRSAPRRSARRWPEAVGGRETAATSLQALATSPAHLGPQPQPWPWLLRAPAGRPGGCGRQRNPRSSPSNPRLPVLGPSALGRWGP